MHKDTSFSLDCCLKNATWVLHKEILCSSSIKGALCSFGEEILRSSLIDVLHLNTLNKQTLLIFQTGLKAVFCNYVFVIFAKISIMIWQQNKMQVSCVKIHCLWLRSVSLIWFARIHRSWLSTANQSQGECLRSVSQACAYTAGSPLPHAAHTGQCPSPAQAQCPLLPDQILSSPNCKRRAVNNNRDEKCPTTDHVNERKQG